MEAYKGTRRKHNMKFRQIGNRTSHCIIKNSALTLQTVYDCFGQALSPDDDEVLSSLQSTADEHVDQFHRTMNILLHECLNVLERQLAAYIVGYLSSPTSTMMEVTRSAPVHNIASERILGLADSQYRRAPNATIGFIDGKVKAKKNKTLEWLTSKSTEEQNQLVSFTITRARKYRAIRKEREAQTSLTYQKRLKEKHQKRLKEKHQKRNRLFSARVERKIIAALTNMPDAFELQLVSVLPEVDRTLLHDVAQYILDPTILSGKYLYHTWDMGDDGDLVYHGKILEVNTPKKKPIKLRITYWLPQESEDDSADSSVKLSEALTDYILRDLVFSNYIFDA